METKLMESENGSLLLKCSVSVRNDLPSHLTWKFKGQSPDRFNDMHQQLSDNVQDLNNTARAVLSSVLEMRNVGAGHVGRYSCVLSWQWSNVSQTEERHLDMTGETLGRFCHPLKT